LRRDITRITAALDVATLSSSFGEGFSNVVGEAMACEVPCVVTDVGDSAQVVGDTGIVVPPKDPQALADGWRKLIEMGVEGRQRLGRAAREWIQQEYSLESVVTQYENLYLSLADSR
jgi:glycosyltransferase involved in cell wall biosynthesis